MVKTNRRDVLRLGSVSIAVPMLAILEAGCTKSGADQAGTLNTPETLAENGSTEDEPKNDQENSTGDIMKIQYLEVVTPDVDDMCKTYESIQGVTFGEPVQNLGNARTADLPDGGKMGIRAPMRPDEAPVVRPYFLVDDLAAAVAKAKEAGAEIAIESMEIPEHGKIAIFILGGIEHGLWQL